MSENTATEDIEELSYSMHRIDHLSEIFKLRQAAIEKTWAQSVTGDEECGKLLNMVQDKLFQLHSQQQAVLEKGRVNVTEYVNQAHLFPANSLGSDDHTIKQTDLRAIYRRVAACTHPDRGADTVDDFKLAKSLYKARDYEGLCLLYVRVGQGKHTVKTEQLLEFAKNRISAIQKQLSAQELSIGFAALAEVQRGVNPIPKVRSMLRQWHNKLEAM